MPRPPRHDHDAGGDPAVLAAKAALRREVWDALRAAKVARFPGAEGRIPNFTGAEVAAERLRATAQWQAARTVKSNPDSPQWPVRQRALEDGKTLYMAVPRLADERPFFLLDPADLADSPRLASSIKGASKSARTVDVDQLEPVDLVVTGCVAVARDGASAKAAASATSSSRWPRPPGSSARRPSWPPPCTRCKCGTPGSSR